MNHFPQLWSQSWDGLSRSQDREVTPEEPKGLEDGFGQGLSHLQPLCPALAAGVTALWTRVPVLEQFCHTDLGTLQAGEKEKPSLTSEQKQFCLSVSLLPCPTWNIQTPSTLC